VSILIGVATRVLMSVQFDVCAAGAGECVLRVGLLVSLSAAGEICCRISV
jgi:hypothetical protein